MKEKIVLMPFCLEAVFVFHYLKSNGAEVVCFFDNAERLQGLDYYGVPIVTPHSTDNHIILCMKNYFNEMRTQLKGIRINYISTFEELKYNDEEFIHEINEERYKQIATFEAIYADNIKRENGIIRLREARVKKLVTNPFICDTLDVKVTDRCTLKCKYCAASVDYMENGIDNDISTVIRDFSGFLDKVDFVRRVFITGGETFLNPNLIKLLNFITENKEKMELKCGRICLLTNGTVVPKDNVLSSIKKANIFLSISDSKAAGAINKNSMTKLVSKCSFYNIPYGVSYLEDGWRDIQSLVEICDKAEEKSKQCTNIYCPPIENGRYYKCWFLLQMCKIGAIPFDERDSIEISKMTKERFIKYRNGITPGCGWCKGHDIDQRKNNRVVVGEQLTTNRKFSKYDSSS